MPDFDLPEPWEHQLTAHHDAECHRLRQLAYLKRVTDSAGLEAVYTDAVMVGVCKRGSRR